VTRRRRRGGTGSSEDGTTDGGDGGALGSPRSRVCSRSLRLSLVESGASIDTHGLSRITLAIFKSARIIVTWHVPITAHDVINVLAQRWAGRGVFTSSNTELGRGHEVRPLVQLFQLAIIEYAGEDQTSDGIAVSCGTVGI